MINSLPRLAMLAFTGLVAVSLQAQTHHVLAHPHLNLRDVADRSTVVAAIPFGDAVEVSQTRHETALIAGMDGQWVEVTWTNPEGAEVSGVLFDAFIFPNKVPPFFGEKSEDLQFEGFAQSLYPAYHFGEVYAGGYLSCSGKDIQEGMEHWDIDMIFSCSKGQALRMYRMWLTHIFAEYLEQFDPYSVTQYEGLLSDPWDGQTELTFEPEHEWMRESLSLSRYKDNGSRSNVPTYVISLNGYAH